MKILLPVIIILVIFVSAYYFFDISGQEIKLADKLPEAKTVTVIAMNEENGEKVEYDLDKEQIVQLEKLLEENSYTRRISSTIVGNLPEKRYTIFASWDDDSQKHLQISLLGGKYIQILGEYGNHYHGIRNSDFEKEFISIIGL